MPGQFSVVTQPKLPGSYVNYQVEQATPIPVSIGSVVAVPMTHDWGPFKEATAVGSLSEFLSVFGNSTTTPGYYAVAQAFKGEGVAGRGGAGQVIVMRWGAAAAAKATKTLQNSTPASALTLSAKYEGTKGNALKVTVQDYGADTTHTELIVYLGAVEVERYHAPDTNLAALASQINGHSIWLSAAVTLDGVALANVTSSALTGGADGTPLLAADWIEVQAALETQRFGVLAPYDLTDASILTALKTWATNLNLVGKRFMTVVGGDLDEDGTDAAARAASVNSWDFVTLGIGSVKDFSLLDDDGNPVVLSTSQFAPRVAGALAYRGEAMSLTFARFADIDLLNGATTQNVSDAYDAGVMCLEKDSSENPVRLTKARTTYTTTSDPVHPVAIFGEPKFVRTMQNFEMDVTQRGEEVYIGQMPVDDPTRNALLADARQSMRLRERARVLSPGGTVVISSNPPPMPTDDFIKLDYTMIFGRSLEKIFEFNNRVLMARGDTHEQILERPVLKAQGLKRCPMCREIKPRVSGFYPLGEERISVPYCAPCATADATRRDTRTSDYFRRWAEQNPEKYKTNAGIQARKRRARLRGAAVENVDRKIVFERDEGVCGICHKPVSHDDFHLDHVIPLIEGGMHSYANIQLAHPGCNRRKGRRL